VAFFYFDCSASWGDAGAPILPVNKEENVGAPLTVEGGYSRRAAAKPDPQSRVEPENQFGFANGCGEMGYARNA
jgi:hypothetical protein